jgi:hypothetical protein
MRLKENLKQLFLDEFRADSRQPFDPFIESCKTRVVGLTLKITIKNLLDNDSEFENCEDFVKG